MVRTYFLQYYFLQEVCRIYLKPINRHILLEPLTFKFTSDSSSTYPGWDALINCEENLSVAYSELENIKIFPNPVTMGILNISSPVAIKKYEIFDVSSKLIIQKSVSEKELKLDISHFASGNYVIKITDRDSGIHTFKIIKK